MSKTCRGCEKEKPLGDYYKHPTGKDGHRNYCKRCSLDKMKLSRNPEKRKAYTKEYYKKNSDSIKQKTQRWREDNIEKAREHGRRHSKARREIDPEVAKRRARGYALKRKYGITLEQYDELLEKQGCACAVCRRPADNFPTSLAVDHDHVTGRIRGLLCTHCNYRLVAKHRDGELLRTIADYIEQGTEWFVPEKKKKKRKKRAPVQQ